MMLLAVVEYYCITKVDGTIYAGYCFYNCGRHAMKGKHTNIYIIITDKKDLNEYMCGRFNKTGISCGKCKPGLSPFVLSYNLSCVECPDGHKNWWKFALSHSPSYILSSYSLMSMLPHQDCMVMCFLVKSYLRQYIFILCLLQ